MVLVRLQVLAWDRAEFAGPCIRHDSIPRARLVHVRECQGVRDLEARVRELAQRLAWRLRLALQIGRRVDMRSAAAETIATKSRRKVR